MIRRATVFGMLLAATSAWACGADVDSMNESLEYEIKQVQKTMAKGRAAKGDPTTTETIFIRRR